MRELRRDRAPGRGQPVSGLLFESRAGESAGWTLLATLRPHDRPGSVSRNMPDGHRDVIMFDCNEDHSVISRSVFGADMEEGTERVISTAGIEVLATLMPGQSYETNVISDRGVAYTARWTHAHR
jgi:hypothetical protein